MVLVILVVPVVRGAHSEPRGRRARPPLRSHRSREGSGTQARRPTGRGALVLLVLKNRGNATSTAWRHRIRRR
ncbi:hypothetical protein DUI70_3522 [Streptomyces albus]|nr:hypothetical protein SLNHY_3580 [Streptomyces albus]AYN34023.1 hypothetical protein DUI70_3522 [Streptomyces albus]